MTDNAGQRISNTPQQSHFKTPDFSCPTLLSVFAYTLHSDGSPGRCNVRTAEIVSGVMKRAKDCQLLNNLLVGSQWEDYDALAEIDGFNLNHFMKAIEVMAPPSFKSTDVPVPEAFLDRLKTDNTPAARMLWKKFRKAIQSGGYADINKIQSDAQILADSLNSLLEDRNFYEDFGLVVDLYDLYKPNLGLIGVEKRSMPRRRNYGKAGLRKFQAKRINRLIIEAIVPESILLRGRYLSTRGGAEFLIWQLETKDQQDRIQEIYIYGHPYHRERCRQQMIRTLKQCGWDFPEEHVYLGADDRPWNQEELWDPESAQVWCRSLENWKAYESSPKMARDIR